MLEAIKKFYQNDLKYYDYDRLWSNICSFYNEASAKEISQYIYEVFGSCDLPIESYKLDHIAIYIGDYENENEICKMVDFIKNKFRNSVFNFDFGPSYLAPKYYGTPGWWFSILDQFSFNIELFSFRRFGAWVNLEIDQKINFISHKAIRVENESILESILDLYSRNEKLELISFTKKDLSGHTYGHLRNKANDKLIEFIYK